MRSVELFAGAGGLAIGMANAGFHHEAVLEWDHDACETFRENQRRHVLCTDEWDLREVDVRDFDYSSIKRQIVVVSGGPPCQPFSLGGKHGAFRDKRDMFPEAVRAVRELRPRAFIFENVKGLLRHAFAGYFEYILLQLQHPSLVKGESETWIDHRARLERHHTAKGSKAEYKVVFQLLNAADYGVPQRRERVLIVGFRADVDGAWSFPSPTHSRDALLRDQWGGGEYWERHKIPKNRRPKPSKRDVSRIEKIIAGDIEICSAPWTTVRDAIGDMPDPEKRLREKILNHEHKPGARQYPGHTGSPMDEPSKTLKAGAHGVPGGENMLRRLDGSVRYFTVREAARLQTFPDSYVFCGAWTEAMRQLGNAVPVRLAEIVASSVAGALGEEGPAHPV